MSLSTLLPSPSGGLSTYCTDPTLNSPTLIPRATITDYYICNGTHIPASPDYSFPSCPTNRLAYSYVKCLDWEWFLHPRPVSEVPFNGTRNCRELCEELVKGRFAGRWIACQEKHCTDSNEVEAMTNNGGFMRENLNYYSKVCVGYGLPGLYGNENPEESEPSEDASVASTVSLESSESRAGTVGRVGGWKGKVGVFGLVVGWIALGSF